MTGVDHDRRRLSPATADRAAIDSSQPAIDSERPAPRETPAHLKKLAWFLDNSIRLPGGYRIGWDGLIGLIPGVGDLVGLGLSAYILVAAARLGVRRLTLARMCFNVALEAAIGVIPIVGDLFDLGFKANARNLDLIEAYLAEPASVRRSSGILMLVMMLFVGLTLLLAIWAMVLVTMAVMSLLGW